MGKKKKMRSLADWIRRGLRPPCETDSAKHKWKCVKSINHMWSTIKGVPYGLYVPIDEALERKALDPQHSATDIKYLIEWKVRGYNVVYVCFTEFNCQWCERKVEAEFYVHPSFISPTSKRWQSNRMKKRPNPLRQETNNDHETGDTH